MEGWVSSNFPPALLNGAKQALATKLLRFAIKLFPPQTLWEAKRLRGTAVFLGVNVLLPISV